MIERLKTELPLLLKSAKWRKLQKKGSSSARWCLAKLGSIGKKSRKTNEVTRGKHLFSILDEAYPELATAIRDSMCVHLIEQLERKISETNRRVPGPGHDELWSFSRLFI